MALNPDAIKKALDAFLNTSPDPTNVNQLEQRLQLHVSGTDAYIPSYTRQKMDERHGAPIVAVFTRTDPKTKMVFLTIADDPKAKAARKLRSADTMGPAYFAFSVPLRTLNLKLPANRRLVLPLHTLDAPDGTTVFWASFAEIEKELRNVDMEALAAAKKAKAEQAKAKKAAKAAKKQSAAGDQTQS